MRHKKYRISWAKAALCMMAAVTLTAGCSGETTSGKTASEASAEELQETEPLRLTTKEQETTPDLKLDAGAMPLPEDVVLPDAEPMPKYMRSGTQHAAVAQLQERLMKLGFMDNDEPTTYFGSQTERAVKAFQRQNKLDQDGIVGSSTWEAIMSPDAKYYAVSNGDSGDDISRIQNRLYELGYLASADMITGNFGDSTEAAVLKLQEVNGLSKDGKVGQQTMNLMYSEEIKANFLAYGEKSEVVLQSQIRLKELGYMTTEPDGIYGADMSAAIKQFQSRNDLIVDGYLGPSTRMVLVSSQAAPNGMRLGDQGEAIERVQRLLNKYGYLTSGSITGYYGEVTEQAVKSFQNRNSLAADGVLGVQTMTKLTGNNVKKAAAGTAAGGGNSGGGGTQRPSGGNSGGGTSGGGGAPIPATSGTNASALISVASSRIGSPYVWGAKGPNSFDCSGFVYWCLNQIGVKQSYLTSSGWRNVGRYTKITNFDSIQAGDIVVVNGHVGIAAGGGTVIDASSSNGRVVHRSLRSWWRSNFICAWRIFG